MTRDRGVPADVALHEQRVRVATGRVLRPGRAVSGSVPVLLVADVALIRRILGPDVTGAREPEQPSDGR